MKQMNMFIKRKKPGLKKIVKKLVITFAAGTIGMLLAVTMPEKIQRIVENRQERTAVTAWWGTLYPKFCFARFPDENKDQKDDIKISFWLAQALDW